MKAHDLVRSMRKEAAEDRSLGILSTLERSQKFDISALSHDGNGDAHLMKFGSELIYEGLFRPPFPEVYLETTFSLSVGKRTIGIVASQVIKDGEAVIQVAPYGLLDCCGEWHEMGGYAVLTIPRHPLPPPKHLLDERVVTGRKSAQLLGDNGTEQFWSVMKPALGLFIAGIVGISSKSTTLRTEPAPEKLNRKAINAIPSKR
jgi:hypothetical protein